MRVLLAPDSFKGSRTATEICESIELGINGRYEKCEIIKLPMADGGEGTVEALVQASGGKYVQCDCLDPLGRSIMANYGILSHGKTAVIEMAAASGLPLLQPNERNPMLTTSFGTGQLMLNAAERGCSRLIMGIGGSATNDGGAGMLRALGASLLNKNGHKLDGSCKSLAQLDRIDCSTLDKRVKNMKITVACDVKNTLYGAGGATYVFAKQKGASVDMLEEMDKILRRYGEILHQTTGRDVANIKGAGAAGGMGAALLACLDAQLEAGFDVINREIGFEARLKGVDLVITGEGQMNFQSVMGKLPVEVAKLASLHGVKTIAIVGSRGEGSCQAEKYFHAVYEIMQTGMSLEYAMENCGELVRQVAAGLCLG